MQKSAICSEEEGQQDGRAKGAHRMLLRTLSTSPLMRWLALSLSICRLVTFYGAAAADASHSPKQVCRPFTPAAVVTIQKAAPF
jgi:hypothetical protein